MVSGNFRARAVPLTIAGLAGGGWIVLDSLQVWTEDGPGAGLMPKVALGLVVALGLLVTLWPGHAATDPFGEDAPWSKTFLIYGAAIVAMAAAVPFLGFVLPAFLATAAILHFAEDRSWMKALGYAAALILAIVLLFGTALNVQFPDGPAERVLNSVRLL